VRSGDLLWFVAGRGVTVVNAAKLPLHPEPSTERVRIEEVVVDGRPMPLGVLSPLPPRTARVQIDYTVLNLTAPHKTRFRYRLEGFDDDWIDAGGRHSAFYTNLSPREYTFQVIASGSDGSFVSPPAEWRFNIRPMFYQTWWFAVLCVAGTIVLIGASWRIHVHRVRNQFVLLLKERARLSREVHDTLLQSMFGVALECDALHTAAAPHAPELRERLQRLRRRVEADIRDARQSIWNLRSSRLEHQGLAPALNEVGRQLFESTLVDYRFELDGAPREMAPEAEEQLLRIGSEAMSNVVRHAKASDVIVRLSYHEQGVTVTVIDNGQGFDPQRAGADGHIGLETMQERASLIGGALRVDSTPGQGTTVTADVPEARI
jgi:two-component sensor histidine kinase